MLTLVGKEDTAYCYHCGPDLSYYNEKMITLTEFSFLLNKFYETFSNRRKSISDW